MNAFYYFQATTLQHNHYHLELQKTMKVTQEISYF